MKSPQFSPSKLPPASEYAIILGAGASAVVSLATQQVAAATLPVTALVAMGLLNRHRLDQQLKDQAPLGHTLEETTPRQVPVAPKQVTTQPMPEAIAAQPRLDTTAPPPRSLFSRRRSPDQSDFATVQQAALQKIGAYLQQVRQEKALSLRDIHEQTFIQIYMLKAIEVGDLGSLPEAFYIRAFIQKYAFALGLEGHNLAAEFPAT